MSSFNVIGILIVSKVHGSSQYLSIYTSMDECERCESEMNTGRYRRWKQEMDICKKMQSADEREQQAKDGCKKKLSASKRLIHLQNECR